MKQVRNEKRKINVKDESRVMKSLAHARWRDAAVRYLVNVVEGASVHQLLDNATNLTSNKSSSGRTLKYAPTPNQATNVLRRDRRFTSVGMTNTGKGYQITLWKLNRLHVDVVPLLGDSDEE